MNQRNRKNVDLREYLQFTRGKGQNAYREVNESISPRWETTAVVQGLAQKLRNPVICFQNVDGTELPMVTNVCCSFDRVAQSMGWTADELQARLGNALDEHAEPHVVDGHQAPVREVSHEPSAFSLRAFPQLYYTQSQEQAYITAAIVIARDPDSGAHNLSFHRLMIIDETSAAIYMTPGGHLDQITKRDHVLGRRTNIAAVIGSHPIWCFASLVAGALDYDDYDVLNAVLEEPLPLTSSVLDPDLLIPAYAEFALEGYIDLDRTQSEGPFGEFLGYMAETATRPVVEFTHFSHRSEPVYQDIVAGQVEHLTMSSIGLRARLQRDYFGKYSAVADFWLPAAMTVFVSVNEAEPTSADVPVLMRDLLMQERYVKQVVCFDSTVDLRKQASVQSALACFVQADRDIHIYENCDGNGVDPSEIDAKTAKIAIDARSKGRAETSKLPEDFLSEFDLSKWID